ncbi:hypothetical protein BB558_001513 [Smittium angustum]|uniref:SF4 helicase domain-containing protein n=1 Tax=Smittium angustum TaxID=133377 RepID=A0A2U1JBG0_SMIAN|nr:hypothetical protein BB558_005526 [Smittium angustum]PWA02349.1 hypothetical protein BB558_001513 [Smittium angustum]
MIRLSRRCYKLKPTFQRFTRNFETFNNKTPLKANFIEPKTLETFKNKHAVNQYAPLAHDFLATGSMAYEDIEENAKQPESLKDTKSVNTIANEMKNLFILTCQYPKPGLKKNELTVKCPNCSPGKPIKTSYTAKIDVEALKYSCSSCFSTGTWDEYSIAAKKKLGQRSKAIGALSTKTLEKNSYFDENNIRTELDHQTRIKTVEQLCINLKSDKILLKKLTGSKKNELGFDIKTIEKYNVGAITVDSDTKLDINNTKSQNVEDIELDSSKPKKITKNEHSQPDSEKITCFAFVSTALKMDIEQIISNNVDENSIEFTPTLIKAVSTNANVVKTIDMDDISQNHGLFGFHTVPLDSSEVILTGDEFDAMAAYQMTGIPAVCLPTSSFQLPINVIGALDRFEKIYIWLEDSYLGREAAETLSKKLGVDRSLIIHNREILDGKSTKPVQLLSKKDVIVEDILALARPVQHEKIMSFRLLSGSVAYELMNPDLIKGVPSKTLPEYNNIIKGLRPGELTIFSGSTGIGKTTVLSNLSLDFCKSKVSTLWGSFEIPNVRLASKMLTQYAGENLKENQSLINLWTQRFNSLPLYFLKFHGSTNPDTVLETMRHAVYAYDVKHIIIDNLQFMMSMQHSTKGFSGDKYEAQDLAIANFRKFATDEHVHITIVVHTRKEQPGTQLDLNSIFGSAKVTQEADNVIMLQKSSRLASSNKRYLDVLKNRYDGTLGKIHFQFDPDTYLIKPIPAPKLKNNVKVIKAKANQEEIKDIGIFSNEST